MNKALTLYLLSLISLVALGQRLPRNIDGFHYDLTFDVLMSSDLELSGPSNGHQLSFMQSLEFSDKGGWGFGYGLGFGFHNTYNNLGIVKSNIAGNTTTHISILPDSAYSTNKQNTSYFDLPLELRYGGNQDMKGRRFRFQIGIRPGVRLSGSTYLRKDEYAVRYYRISELNRWHIPAYFRLGYGQWSLYASYDLLPYFDSGEYTVIENNAATQKSLTSIHMMSAGVSFTF